MRLIGNVDRHFCTVLRQCNGLGDAPQSIEVMVNRSDAELDRFKVLIGHINLTQHLRKQLDLLGRLALAVNRKALAVGVGRGNFLIIGPGARLNQEVDIGAIGAITV